MAVRDSSSNTNFNEISNPLANIGEKNNDSTIVSVPMKDEKVNSISFKPSSITDSCTGRPDTNVETFTVDQAIDKLGFGPFQFFILCFSSLARLAASLEMLILSILSPAVKCQWSLSNDEEAIITSLTFVGFFFGSVFLGIIGDNFGRKKAILGMSLIVLISGLLCAFKLTPDDSRIPGYYWMLVCRFGVGFGAAGANQAAAYYIEFLPRKNRAICTLIVVGSLSVGIILGASLAVVVMGPNKLGLHWYLGFAAIPMAVTVCCIPFIPESARLHASRGKKKESMQVLRWIAWFNFRSLPPGELLISLKTEEEGNRKEDIHVGQKDNGTNEVGVIRGESASITFRESFTADNGDADASTETKHLLFNDKGSQLSKKKSLTKGVFFNIAGKLSLQFTNGMWKTTLGVWCLWFGSSWLYFGGVLLNTTMLLENPLCDGNESALSISNLSYEYSSGSGFDGNTSNATSCEELDTGDYLDIMWSTLAEIPGLLVNIAIVEIIGRKLTIFVNLMMTMLSFFLLYICTGKAILTLFFFIIRAFSSGAIQAMTIYTLEVYPTNIRGVGVGITSSLFSFGGVVTPYVAQVLFPASEYATIGLYGGSCLALMLVALLLPIETKGKSLK